MYDFLRGAVAHVDPFGRLALDVGGVGYSLRVSEPTRRSIALDGTAVTLWVRLQVKEDDLVLFGFSDVAERAAFDLLTQVQGVGPAVAMAVLNECGVLGLRAALANRDAGSLRKAKGVGPKSAERIVLELADKLDRIPLPMGAAAAPGSAPTDQAGADALRGLVALGFSSRDAADAVAKIPPATVRSAEALLRAALSILRG
jgi:Holliday junction DNA helicase RuvA